eukprot:4980766-Amphidinium_carterae.1
MEASVAQRMAAASPGSKRGPSAASNLAANEPALLVCFQCLPVVVNKGVVLCGLSCGSSVCARHARRRTIRDQMVT